MDAIFGNPLLLFGLIIVAMFALGIFAYTKFGSALQAKFRGAPKVPAIILGKGPEAEEIKLLVDNVFFLSNPKTEEAWAYVPHAMQYKTDGSPVGYLLSHDTCMPQFTDKSIDVSLMYDGLISEIKSIALSQFSKAWETEVGKAANSALGEWLGLAGMVAVSGVVIVVCGIMVSTLI